MNTERLPFKTELQQLLNLITHSLYSNKEVFLRELISNAGDAIDRLRFNSLSHGELLEGDSNWKIKITPDAAAGTLTVSDNGVGMSRETIIEDLGTIARSGTQAFLRELKEANAQDRPELIGQFGVGFYASFMVADKVTVISRPAGQPGAGVRWESDGQGEFTVEPAEKATRGTDVILHLRADEREWLEPWRLRQIVQKFSDFIEHPVVMEVEQENEQKEKTRVEETLNTRKALWLRPKAEIQPEEYTEFYKHLARDVDAPARTIHYVAEGATEFRACLFIPAHKPFDLIWGEPRSQLHLYIRRVFIMDNCAALLPGYLRFVRGVVDCADLPLNVSRELLQQNPLLERIQKNITKKVLDTLAEMKRDEREAYVTFFRGLGAILKEGVSQDWSNRERIAELLLFESTKTAAGQFTALDEYVAGMPAGQTEIYYLIGESRELLDHSPLLEGFQARGFEVLLMTEPFDEFMVQSLTEFKGKRLRSVERGALPADEGQAQQQKEAEEKYAGLLKALGAKLPEVQAVRLSTRLKDSAACLVADERAASAHLERLMERIGCSETVPHAPRILELNAAHPLVEALRALHEKDAADPRLETYARLLHDQAVVAEGSKLKDPGQFTRRINEVLLKELGG
jgi:molecular chaperone HtpG